MKERLIEGDNALRRVPPWARDGPSAQCPEEFEFESLADAHGY